MCRKPITLSELKSVKHCTMSMLPDKDSNCFKCTYHTNHILNNDTPTLKYYSEKIHLQSLTGR